MPGPKLRAVSLVPAVPQQSCGDGQSGPILQTRELEPK